MAIENTNFKLDEIHNFFTNAKRIFFIGIGGISMSSLATYCVYLGKEVFGYDRTRSRVTKKLEKICNIKYYSTPDNVSCMDMVIFTGAIDESNFEYKRANELKIPTISRANFLGYIISRYKTKIGVSGMHGKSTTCALITHIFDYASRNPTSFCGAEMKLYDSACLIKKGQCCIFEACEYMNSFLSLPCDDAVILNIDFDHPDFFKSLDDIKCSFNKFANKAKRVFINADDEASTSIVAKEKITFGIKSEAMYKAKIIHSPDFYGFEVYKNGALLGKCKSTFFGEHFIYDALCAFSVASENNIAPSVICGAISSFMGSERRMELIKKTDTGAPVFMDYAHHPTEIKASLCALLEMGYKKILCVFQSHTYSRTFFLYDEFTKAFEDASKLVILPIDSAREENIYEITDEGFARDCGGIFLQDLCATSSYIKNCECDCVVIMGAGDIYKLVKFL